MLQEDIPWGTSPPEPVRNLTTALNTLRTLDARLDFLSLLLKPPLNSVSPALNYAEEVHYARRTPINDGKQEPQSKLEAKEDILLFRESIRAYFQHTLCNQKDMCSTVGAVAPMLPIGKEEQMADMFAKTYVDEYTAGSKLCFISEVPSSLITVGKVKIAFLSHLKSLKNGRTYPNSSSSLRHKRRQIRRKRKFDARQSFAVKHRLCQDQCLLLNKLGTSGMSDEESDAEQPDRFAQIVRPGWRSHELDIFLHSLNELKRFEKAVHNVHKVDHMAAVVMGLPQNCYDTKWLENSVKGPMVRESATTAIPLGTSRQELPSASSGEQ
ncbi:hypothetical protein M408DRAFT_23857 [Serendipita vermifera MAFF 305830]|uniref:Uncharacterized protein n=1 Tax=Serendipita vermifera MAFF 305830 TaxID=933852 RepID=A0A0C3B9P3_SERVB|nr:hypothetical protein M408DRAFT_23857 [Serendipita vermifera MAFF 305830]